MLARDVAIEDIRHVRDEEDRCGIVVPAGQPRFKRESGDHQRHERHAEDREPVGEIHFPARFGSSWLRLFHSFLSLSI